MHYCQAQAKDMLNMLGRTLDTALVAEMREASTGGEYAAQLSRCWCAFGTDHCISCLSPSATHISGFCMTRATSTKCKRARLHHVECCRRMVGLLEEQWDVRIRRTRLFIPSQHTE